MSQGRSSRHSACRCVAMYCRRAFTLIICRKQVGAPALGCGGAPPDSSPFSPFTPRARTTPEAPPTVVRIISFRRTHPRSPRFSEREQVTTGQPGMRAGCCWRACPIQTMRPNAGVRCPSRSKKCKLFATFFHQISLKIFPLPRTAHETPQLASRLQGYWKSFPQPPSCTLRATANRTPVNRWRVASRCKMAC